MHLKKIMKMVNVLWKKTKKKKKQRDEYLYFSNWNYIDAKMNLLMMMNDHYDLHYYDVEVLTSEKMLVLFQQHY